MTILLSKNMEMMDRAIRACFGTALVVLVALVFSGITGVILVLLSAPLLLIAISGFCPGCVSFEMGSKQKSTLKSPGDTKGNDQIISTGIESLWLMPHGTYDQTYGHRAKRANS